MESSQSRILPLGEESTDKDELHEKLFDHRASETKTEETSLTQKEEPIFQKNEEAMDLTHPSIKESVQLEAKINSKEAVGAKEFQTQSNSAINCEKSDPVVTESSEGEPTPEVNSQNKEEQTDANSLMASALSAGSEQKIPDSHSDSETVLESDSAQGSRSVQEDVQMENVSKDVISSKSLTKENSSEAVVNTGPLNEERNYQLVAEKSDLNLKAGIQDSEPEDSTSVYNTVADVVSKTNSNDEQLGEPDESCNDVETLCVGNTSSLEAEQFKQSPETEGSTIKGLDKKDDVNNPTHETPFLTYSQSFEKDAEMRQDTEDGVSTTMTMSDGQNLSTKCEAQPSNVSEVAVEPFNKPASPEQPTESLFKLSGGDIEMSKCSSSEEPGDLKGSGEESVELSGEGVETSEVGEKTLLSTTIAARKPDLMEEISMSSQSSRDSVDTETKSEAMKVGSEVESEAGSVKEKKKAPAKRRNDLTQKMEDVPTSQPEEHRPEEHLYEYKWPAEGRGETYMLQEQISEYLGVLSFKRKYPDLERRNIDVKERLYLREKGVVTEMQADLGLTAVRADLIHDLMARDYPGKYKLYLAVLKERRKQQALERQREIQAQKTDKVRLEQLRQKAMQSAAKYNAAFNKERREERRAYFDMHTFEIQFPRKQKQILPPEATKPGAYPVTLIPGQFQDYYKQYTSTELRYLPVNTAMYSSPCKVSNPFADPGPLPSDEEVSMEVPTSEISTESSEAGSDIESMDLGSEMLEEEEEQQTETGKSPEQRKGEISRKVQEILERLKDKDKKSPRRRTKPPGGDESPAPKKKKVETDTESERSRTPQRRKKAREVVAALCNICGGTESQNSSGTKENLVQCSECRRYGHPSCLELTPEMILVIKSYPWQCMECKTCVECKDSQNEDKMLFCDRCDRGFHTFCVGLASIPNGRWECPSCRLPAQQDTMPRPPPIAPAGTLPTSNVLSELRPAPTSGIALIAAMPHSKAQELKQATCN